jgi:ribosomal protein L29
MTQPTTELRRYTRSEIAAMSQQQLADNADELLAAMRDGRIEDAPPEQLPEPHPSGKPYINRSDLAQLSSEQLAERADELLEAAREGRIRTDR